MFADCKSLRTNTRNPARCVLEQEKNVARSKSPVETSLCFYFDNTSQEKSGVFLCFDSRQLTTKRQAPDNTAVCDPEETQSGFMNSGVYFKPHLWRDDVEQIPGQSVLLSEDVVLVRFEGDAVHVDDERAGRQIQRDAVLPQEALQLGGLLPQELQGHLGAWEKKKGGHLALRNPNLIPRFSLSH